MKFLSVGLLLAVIAPYAFCADLLVQFDCATEHVLRPLDEDFQARKYIKILERRSFESPQKLVSLEISLGALSFYDDKPTFIQYDNSAEGEFRAQVETSQERYHIINNESSEKSSTITITDTKTHGPFSLSHELESGENQLYFCQKSKYKITAPQNPFSHLKSWDDIEISAQLNHEKAQQIINEMKEKMALDKKSLRFYFFETKEVGKYYLGQRELSTKEVELLEDQWKDLSKEDAAKLRAKYVFSNDHLFYLHAKDLAAGEKYRTKVMTLVYFFQVLEMLEKNGVFESPEEVIDAAQIIYWNWCSANGFGVAGDERVSFLAKNVLESEATDEETYQAFWYLEKYGRKTYDKRVEETFQKLE